MPDALRRAVRKDAYTDLCVSCSRLNRDSLHGVLIVCNCGGVVAMCRDCFNLVLDATETALGVKL